MRDSEIFPLRGEAHHPWHVYAGVVLTGPDNKIVLVRSSDGTLMLPRDTLTTNENFVSATHRFVLERVKVVPHLEQFLGTITTRYIRYDNSAIEKTVMYFHATFRSPYYGKYVDGLRSDYLLWVPLSDAFQILAQEPHGEEVLVERIQAGAPEPLYSV